MGTDWLSIKFATEFDLSGFSAKFILGTHQQTWETLVDGETINLTAQETNALDVGLQYATLVVWDNEGNSKPFSTAIPVMVRDWVDGQYQKLDTFHMSVNARFEGETVMTITIETAKVSEQMVDGKIAEHNSDETAHQFIQQNLTIEAMARADADNQLQSNIDTKQDKLTSANAGDNITITEEDGIVKISSKGGAFGEIDGGTANSVYIEGLQELDGGNAEEP